MQFLISSNTCIVGQAWIHWLVIFITWSYRKNRKSIKHITTPAPVNLHTEKQRTIENPDWEGGRTNGETSCSICVSFLLLKNPTTPLNSPKLQILISCLTRRRGALLNVGCTINLSLQLLCATDTPPMIKKTRPTRLKIKPHFCGKVYQIKIKLKWSDN